MLSTILVNFNHGHFLPFSIGSLLAQTRGPDELIVIDDASTDGSVDVVSEYLPKFLNARLIRHRSNMGVVANMNEGLQVARGDIIHFAAADDVFYPRMYEVGTSLLEQHRGAALFSARSDSIDAAGRNLNLAIPPSSFPVHLPAFLAPADAERLLLSYGSWFMGNTALFHRAPLLAEHGFPEDLQSYSDGYICQLLALKYGGCFSPERLAGWRRLDEGFSSSLGRCPEKASSLILAVGRKMQDAGDVFPPSYVRRWKARAEFSVKRQALALERAQAKKAGVNLRLSWCREKISLGMLLVRLRSRDILRSARRHLGTR